MLSFTAPSSGMFVWVKLHFEAIPKPEPRGGEGEGGGEGGEETETTEIRLWTKLAQAGVLAAPGWFFAADMVEPPTDPNEEGHMRMSFSNADVSACFLFCMAGWLVGGWVHGAGADGLGCLCE